MRDFVEETAEKDTQFITSDLPLLEKEKAFKT